MAHDEAVAARIRRALAKREAVREQQMMGALCFMVNGHMCCGVSGDALMIRVGRDSYAAALAEPHVRPLEMKDRRPAGFVLIDPPGFAGAARLRAWLMRGLATVAALPAKA